MIAYIEGQILKKLPKGIILKTGEIGYFVFLTADKLSSLKEGEKEKFFIHHHFKEAGEELYGFHTYEDLEFFILLLSVKGIGPKVAMAILNFTAEKVKSAILNEDEKFISKIPGIGKKISKRIIIELKEKIDLGENLTPYKFQNKNEEEAIEALLSLGYQRKEIHKKIKDLPKEIEKTEEIIKYLLQN